MSRDLHLARECFWCKRMLEPKRLTRDHLIPIWACRIFPELGPVEGPHRVVKSCGPCNAAKGGMPPETYYRVRLQSGARKAQSLYWHGIQEYCAKEAVDPHVRAFIVDEMLKPIPGWVPPETTTSPFPKPKPPKKTGPERLPAYTCGEVPATKVLDWEKLNPNLSAERPIFSSTREEEP